MSEWDELEESRMPITGHLAELRGALLRTLLVVVAATCVTYYFSDSVVFFLEKPILEALPKENARLYFTGITDKFFIYLQVSLISALFLSAPYLFFELWKFVSPGLYRRERKFAVPFIGFASIAFIIGLAFGFWVVIPYGYRFLVNFGNPSDQPMITLKEYFGLTLKLLMAMGIVFEVPVLFVLLAKIGLVDIAFLRKNRGIAFVASAVIAAVITPTPDAFTMLLVMIPLYLLYEVSIFTIRWFVK